MYAELAGEAVAGEEIKNSIKLVAGFSDRQFQTVIAPVRSEEGGLRYLTPDEIGETAAAIAQASGSNQQPYMLRLFRPLGEAPALQALEPMNSGMLFPYRSKARTFQVRTEIERDT
jgi:hypothetical protein